MKKLIVSTILAGSVLSAGYSLAQDTEEADIDEPAIEATEDVDQDRPGREPIDLAQFSKLDDLKAADENGDGTLAREEVEAYVLQQMVQRRADRMERRLDINGDGTITIEEIEKQREKEFAALDRNEDGKLDRSELRAGFGKHGRHGGHGFHHFRR